jgi:hypothetical protein
MRNELGWCGWITSTIRAAAKPGSADCQAAVSPTGSRLGVEANRRLRITNPRHSRLATCATADAKRSGTGFQPVSGASSPGRLHGLGARQTGKDACPTSRLAVACMAVILTLLPARAATAELKDLSFTGGIQDGKARLVIEALLAGAGLGPDKALFSTATEQAVTVGPDKVSHVIRAKVEVLQGEPAELPFTFGGDGEIRSVTGDGVLDWAVRQGTNGVRTLVVRPRKADKPPTGFNLTITAEHEVRDWSQPLQPLTLTTTPAVLSSGYVRLDAAPSLDLQPTNTVGLAPVPLKFLPEGLRVEPKPDAPEPLGFRFQGSDYALPLVVTVGDPDSTRVVLRDFQLEGQLAGEDATFTLTASALVKNPRGGTLALLSGAVALADLERNPDVRLRFRDGRFELVFDRPGSFPLRLKFNAGVRANAGWNAVDFRIAPGVLAPVTLRGLAADTQFEFAGAAKPERSGDEFRSFLPPDGTVKLAWKEARPEVEGRLFYAAEMRAQISVSPGLMRQTALIEGRVMQGELSRLVLAVRGAGNVTAVQGANVLSWQVEPGAAGADRRLVVQFNQPQNDAFALQVQMQSELGAFPQAMDAMQLRPEGATRFAGHFRVVNEGAVRLEVVQASGLSQVSPEQFPESDATKALFGTPAGSRFAFRFSSADFALRINADNVLPEVGVSELLAYHLGETELAVDAEFELDIREAPLREVLLRVPRGFVVARLNAAGMNDYFLRDVAETGDAELRLVYGQPVADRQVIQLRLERNGALGETNWSLPRLEVLRAKSTRGHVAVSADAGFRLTPERTQALTDIATAFFPRKVAGIQAAFRLTDPAWSAALRVERLPQSVQADVFHLFSIGEGIAYGSSTMNFFIAGAPVSSFLVALSDEYFNVEFTGKDVRNNWQRTTNGYLVTLNTPVSGAYTLLATYERPFKPQGDTLTFTGARPVDAQSEQGHTLVVSAYQFQVTPANVSAGLLELETAEVPAEYRLFFDAPILKAYRYTARPFNLQLALSPLAQAETLSLVVDRAALTTRISKDGEVITDAQYFVKNRGNPHLRLALPAGTKLWSATVNGTTVVPVQDGDANLIPLPQKADPNTVQRLDLKLASKSANPSRVTAAAPIVAAPVMLAEWRLEPDTGRRLTYRRGSLAPAAGVPDISGFAGLARAFRNNGDSVLSLFFAVALTAGAVGAWRWAVKEGATRFGVRRLGGTVVGCFAVVLSTVLWLQFAERLNDRQELPRSLHFLAPVQQSGSALTVEVANNLDSVGAGGSVLAAWPAALALAVWVWAWVREPGFVRSAATALGWTLLGWAALRQPNGAPLGLLVLIAFLILKVIVPALRALVRVPAKPKLTPATPAAAALLVGALVWFSDCGTRVVAQSVGSPTKEPALAESVVQDVRVADRFAFATAKLRWHAQKDQTLPVLFDPAVLTRIQYPTNALKLVRAGGGAKPGQQLLALQAGSFDIELSYQLQVATRDGGQGFVLPTHHGLVNRLKLTLADLDVDVSSASAVSVRREAGPTNTTIANLVLAPSAETWIGWKPRSRDVKREAAVFYADLTQLHVPAAGVIEGVHSVQIRPAQGEILELSIDVPAGSTITDVLTPIPAGDENKLSFAPNLVSLWRFDPDTRRLRVTLSAPQSRPFTLVVRSQIATGPLPVEQSAGLLSVVGAAGQVGSLGVATGNEVQLDTVTADGFSALNLEDFPVGVLDPLRNQIAGLTLRRAFRQGDAKGTVSLKASAVEPDVRVETQETLSLGEDRTVLAVNAGVTVTRAGIFRLSFVLPAGLDVEAISGAALSHWTELKALDGRVITLHLKGKTEGQQQFNVSLTGPGTRATTNYVVPKLAFREAGKQRGQLVIVPEQGMRFQVGVRDGVTQLDPEKAGIRQKGVLAFRLLQPQWALALSIEQVDAWVQVTGLQHVTVSEAQLKVLANLQYQIENTGLKALRVRVPTNAESVRFRGDQVADFLPVAGSVTNGTQVWEVKLHRRIIGKQMLQVTWQTPLNGAATNATVVGVGAVDANLQRGFVTVQSGGRLQVSATPPAAALQPAEWQSIPRALLQDLPNASANFTYRIVEPAFQLPLALVRHEATKLLPARVNNVTLTSVISDEGVMLTQVRLELIPGDKRLLSLALPAEAKFWFAFVNQNGVWPWRETNRVLVPLEQQSKVDQATTVELFYSSRIGQAGGRKLDLALLGPKFDLPLENITWQVYLNDKWKLADWSGSLELQDQSYEVRPLVTDVKSYLDNELVVNQAKTKAAEQMLSAGNTLLQQGDPTQARRAFNSAFGLSTHDSAFNEDARVQLHNLKLQQALVGLNVRQNLAGGDAAPAPGNLKELRNRRDAAYTQQEAKQLIDANTAEDNATLMRLAERIVQQQDAAVPTPTAIRATVPQQGCLLTFRRTVQVDEFADLGLRLKATSVMTASWGFRVMLLVGLFAVMAGFAWLTPRGQRMTVAMEVMPK